jgi:hypothetical protein
MSAQQHWGQPPTRHFLTREQICAFRYRLVTETNPINSCARAALADRNAR